MSDKVKVKFLTTLISSDQELNHNSGYEGLMSVEKAEQYHALGCVQILGKEPSEDMKLGNPVKKEDGKEQQLSSSPAAPASPTKPAPPSEEQKKAIADAKRKQVQAKQSQPKTTPAKAKQAAK